MKLIKVSPNILLSEDKFFGEFDTDVVFQLLRHVDECFSEALEVKPFTSKPCLISYNHYKDNPKCTDLGSGFAHHIFLHVSDNYWCKWIYQFAHEYCHHLINGPMIGGIAGLIWFEECVCELSSMYHLQNMALYCDRSHLDNLQSYAHHVRSYLRDLKEEGFSVSGSSNQGFLYRWGNLLKEPKYHRSLYKAIAVRMLPLFEQNPRLWKMILHFGDTRKWNNMEDFFRYLTALSTPDYRDSLIELQRMFF